MNKMTDKKFGLGVFVCIFNKDFSKILLLKRNEEKRKKHGADWGNIGGKMEFGELSKDACLREAREEIGIEIDPEKLKLIEVKEKPDHYPGWHSIYFVYSIVIDETCPVCVNEESDECKWFPIDNLPESMLDSKEDVIKWSILARKAFKK